MGRLPVRPGPQCAPHRRDHRRARSGAPPQRKNRPVSAPLQGLHVVDLGQLEPRAAGCREGRMDRRRGQPALSRHLAVARRAPGPPSLREALLRSWRDGEPHQEPALAKAGECQLDLFADRTSAATMRANQLRLWFAAMAYVMLCGLRRIALRHTQFAQATCGTIRLKLFKIGALVRVSVRRIKIAMASAFPYRNEFALAHSRLTAAAH